MTFSKTDLLILDLMPHFRVVVYRRDPGADIAAEIDRSMRDLALGRKRPRDRQPRQVYIFRNEPVRSFKVPRIRGPLVQPGTPGRRAAVLEAMPEREKSPSRFVEVTEAGRKVTGP